MGLWRKGAAEGSAGGSRDGLAARIDRTLRPAHADGDVAEAALAVGPRGDALAAIDAALAQLKRAKTALGEAAKIVIAAAAEEDIGKRALLAERYEDAKAAIDALGGEDAPSLLHRGGRLMVPIGRVHYAVETFVLGTGDDALRLPPPQEGFATHADVACTLKQVEFALERMAKAERGYQRDKARLSRGFTERQAGAA